MECLCLVPRITRIQLPIPDNPLKNVNIYVLQSNGSAMIVDAGVNSPACRRELWTALDALTLHYDRTCLFLTHFHADHIGLVWDFVSRGISVYTGEQEYAYFSQNDPDAITAQMSATFVREGLPIQEKLCPNQLGVLTMPPSGFPVIPLPDGHTLHIGSVAVQTICTPGHTPGHTVLYLPREKLLFAGDCILFDITPNISIWLHVDRSLSDYLNSLRKLRRFPTVRCFPAHRDAGASSQMRIEALLAHHEKRLAEMTQIIKQTPGLTAYEIAGKMHWSIRGASWDQFPATQKWFAMSETLAHLKRLMEDGTVLRSRKDEGYSYHAIAGR